MAYWVNHFKIDNSLTFAEKIEKLQENEKKALEYLIDFYAKKEAKND